MKRNKDSNNIRYYAIIRNSFNAEYKNQTKMYALLSHKS
jgi:hypothetical protein